jgi:hypothetical protein
LSVKIETNPYRQAGDRNASHCSNALRRS